MNPTLSMAYARAVLDSTGLPPSCIRDLLLQAGISPALFEHRAARVTERQFAALFRALAVKLDDEMLGLWSRPLRPGALKFTCLGLMGARSLRVALHRWSIILRLLQDDFVLELDDDGREACVTLRPLNDRPRPVVADDLMLKLVHGVASWLIGESMPLTRVDFAFPRPAFAAEYATLYPGPMYFEQPRSAFSLDAAWLQRPPRRAAADLGPFLRRAPEGWMFPAFADQRVSLRVRELLLRGLAGAAPTAEQAAQALHLSPRTLHRRLAEEGTGFQRIKDELRRDLAIERLTDGRRTVAAVAAELGFEDAASFHRAFRGWTGQTPGAYRPAAVPSRRGKRPAGAVAAAIQ